jgi:vancomycin resistance protein YoaR
MKKKAIILILFATIITVSAYFGYVHFTVKDWNNLIYTSVKVEETDLSGMTKEEALNHLKEKYSDSIIKKKISIETEKKVYTLDYSQLDAKYNINETVNKAFEYGKNEKLLKKYKLIKNPLEKVLQLKFDYNADAINQLVDEMKKDINTEPVDAEITMIKRGVFDVKPEVVGLTLDDKKIKNDILNSINGKLTDEDEIKIQVSIIKTIPKYTKDVLSTINEKIVSYSTKFYTSGASRANNIILATEAINGTLLLPGEEFSFNGIVGQRTAERGYQAAHVIVNNKLVDGLGGGICQVSSTLYNVMLLMNVDPTQRQHHTIASSYVPIGQDATVSWPDTDYKFVNTLEYPIYIEGFTYNKQLFFNIYSNDSLKKWTYKIKNDVYEVIEAKVEIVEDPNMYEDEEKIEKAAFRGFKANVYREVYENGVFIKKETVSKEYIPAVNGITKKGTKKREVIEDTENADLEENSNN